MTNVKFIDHFSKIISSFLNAISEYLESIIVNTTKDEVDFLLQGIQWLSEIYFSNEVTIQSREKKRLVIIVTRKFSKLLKMENY